MAAGQSVRKRPSFSEMGIWFREPALAIRAPNIRRVLPETEAPDLAAWRLI